MSTKYVITFSNCTEKGIETPEKIHNQTVLEFVTDVLANAAKISGYDLDNCTAYSVNGMYKGVSETSFRLEYIVSDSMHYSMIGYALWIKLEYKQESVLLESYTNGVYKAELVFDIGHIVEL